MGIPRFTDFSSAFDAAQSFDRRESRVLEFAAVVALLTLYFVRFIPQVFISDGIPKLSLPLAFSYYADTLLFAGWKANPLIRDVVVSTAPCSLNYPLGLYALIRIAQAAFGETVFHLNLLFFIVQAVVPVFSFLILRRFTGRLWALLAAWFITSQSVYIYTIPDFYNQVLILASIWLLLKRCESGRSLLLVPVGFLCGLNVVFKQNIGLAWSAAVAAFIFLQNGSARDAVPPVSSSRWLGLAAAAVFPVYGAVVSSLFATWDNWLLFTLPFAVFWVWTMMRLARRDLLLDDRGFLCDLALFAAPFALTALGVFLAYSWDIGPRRYFDFLFGNSVANKGIWDKGVSIRGLVYYGTDGRPDLLDPRKLRLLLLWFFPFLANLGMVFWLVRAKSAQASAPVSRLAMMALSIVGVYTFFPLESYFNLSTKLCLPVLALAAAFAGRLEGRGSAQLATLLLALFVLLPSFKSLRHDVRLWEEREQRLAWMPGPAGHYLPKPIAAELQRSLDLLRANIDGKFYFIGSSADMVMYYRLLGQRSANYYTDLREGFLSRAAEADLIRVLGSYPWVVVQKSDLDLRLRDPEHGNQTLAETLDHVAREYRTVATYLRPPGAQYAGLEDLYLMRKR